MEGSCLRLPRVSSPLSLPFPTSLLHIRRGLFDLSITLHQLDKKSQTPFNIVYLHYLAVLLSVVNLQAASHLANRSRRKQAAHHCSTTRPCSSPSIVLSIVILLRGHSEGLALSFNSRSDGQARDEEHLSSLSALLSLIFSYVGTDRAVSSNGLYRISAVTPISQYDLRHRYIVVSASSQSRSQLTWRERGRAQDGP